MNDSLNGKNGKVKVMYVRSEDKPDDQKKSDRRGGRNSRGPRGDRNERSNRGERGERSSDRGDRGERRGQGSYSDDGRSPWKTVSRQPSEDGEALLPDHGGISGKSQILPSCVVSARKRPVFTGKTPVRQCSAAALSALCGPGLFSPSHRVSAMP